MEWNGTVTAVAKTARAGESPRQGERTRRRILARAADIASVEGLEGLTIGRLAADLNCSKSGLFAHFGSKEELQLATVVYASEQFKSKVLAPSHAVPRGRARLEALLDTWMRHIESDGFPGGCFFAAAAHEFDGRPGPVRDRLATAMKWWFETLRDEFRHAQQIGEFRAEVDAVQITFKIHAMAMEANWGCQMYKDPVWFLRGRQGIQEFLNQAAA